MTKYLSIAAIAAALFACGLSAQTNLLNEAFTTFPPTGWTVTNNSTSAPASTVVWAASTAGPSTYPGSINGTQFALCDADAGGGSGVVDSTLTSTTFNGTTASGALFLSFSHYFQFSFTGDIGTVEVYNGSTWVQVYQVTATTGDWTPSAAVQNIDISAYKNAANRVRFRYTDAGNWGWWWAIDDVRVYYYTGPEIDVQRPAGTANSIPTGGQAQVGTGTASTLMNATFTVANQGAASLTHTVTVAASPAPVNCTPGTPTLAASTAPAATSTLTVPVTPTAAGLFSLRISITNNDTTGSENPYLIDIIGFVLGGNVLFYGGNLDSVDGLVNGRGFAGPNDVQIFDNFTVPAGPNWSVTQLYSNNVISAVSGVTFTADWEIRTGMSTGVGGTLVSSGTGVPCAVFPTGNSAFGSPEYTVIAQLATPVNLAPGSYYFNIRPVRVGNVGTSYVTTTAGTSGVGTPLTDGVSFAHEVTGTQYGGIVYQDMASLIAAYDFSMGVRGTTSSSPTLSVSTNAVTVPTTTAGTAGTATSFTVSGSNLTPASGTVTLALVSTPAGIQMRNATAAGTFGTGNITINYTSGAFAAQTIEVRFASTATATTYTGTITISGGGATNQVVNLSGTVNAAGTPTLTPSTNNVTVPTTTAGTAGTATSFTVSGSNLTPATGSVTLALVSTPAGIEMRNATAAGTFGTGNITINYTSGAFAAQTIEVRFAASATATSYTGTITISGGGAANQVVNLSGTVTATGGALTIVTTTLPNGVVGTAYNATITAQNGTGPYTWSLASGTLPTGLTLNTAATGLTTSLSGTPTAAGVFTFTIQVADSAAGTDTQLYNVTVTSSGGGSGTIGGGGGGGGGCSVDGHLAPWMMLAAAMALLAVTLRRRARA